MDFLSSMIYIVLFIVLMIFIFSMGLLTPINEKKDILSVLAIGFIVGIVGGAFFITPIYQDIPSFIGTVQEVLGGTETMNIEISPTVNYTKVMDDLNTKEGVVSVVNRGIHVKTDPFPKERKKLIEERLIILDENFKSFDVDESGEICINFTSGYNPKLAIEKLSDWLMYTGGINLRYSLIRVQVTVNAGHVDEITQYLHSNNIVVSSVNGSVQDAIRNTQESMLDDTGVILLSGLIGTIVALISIFYDNISSAIRNFWDKLKNQEKVVNLRKKINLSKIKRKINISKIKNRKKNNKKRNDKNNDYNNKNIKANVKNDENIKANFKNNENNNEKQ